MFTSTTFLTVVLVIFAALTFFATIISRSDLRLRSYMKPFFSELMGLGTSNDVWKKMRRVLGYWDLRNILFSFANFVLEILLLFFLPYPVVLIYTMVIPATVVYFLHNSVKKKSLNFADIVLGFATEVSPSSMKRLRLYSFVLYSLFWNISLIVIVASNISQPIPNTVSAATVTIAFFIFPFTFGIFAMDDVLSTNFTDLLDRLIFHYKIEVDVWIRVASPQNSVIRGTIEKVYPYLVVTYAEKEKYYKAMIRWRDIMHIAYAVSAEG